MQCSHNEHNNFQCYVLLHKNLLNAGYFCAHTVLPFIFGSSFPIFFSFLLQWNSSSFFSILVIFFPLIFALALISLFCFSFLVTDSLFINISLSGCRHFLPASQSVVNFDGTYWGTYLYQTKSGSIAKSNNSNKNEKKQQHFAANLHLTCNIISVRLRGACLCGWLFFFILSNNHFTRYSLLCEYKIVQFVSNEKRQRRKETRTESFSLKLNLNWRIANFFQMDHIKKNTHLFLYK